MNRRGFITGLTIVTTAMVLPNFKKVEKDKELLVGFKNNFKRREELEPTKGIYVYSLPIIGPNERFIIVHSKNLREINDDSFIGLKQDSVILRTTVTHYMALNELQKNKDKTYKDICREQIIKTILDNDLQMSYSKHFKA